MAKVMTEEQKAKIKAGRDAWVAAGKPKKQINNISLTTNELEEVKRTVRYLPSAETAFREAFAGKSLAAAIKAKCVQCSCWQRAEITLCKVEACALWRYRPFQGAKVEANPDVEPETNEYIQGCA